MNLLDNPVRLRKYHDAIAALPPSGSGLHRALLGVANHGVMAGLTGEQIFTDLRANVTGSRRVSDVEISDAITKAINDKGNWQSSSLVTDENHAPAIRNMPPTKKTIRNPKQVIEKLIELGRGYSEDALRECSPVELSAEPKNDARLVMVTLYNPSELIFVGSRPEAGMVGVNIRTATAWAKYFANGGKPAEHVIPNPLSGRIGITKKGTDSYRADDCVSSFRFAVVEFDNLSREDQIAFWSAINLPICALIDSGGKSIHAWLDVRELAPEVKTADDWTATMENYLYRELLQPLGVDAACKNEGRLSRLPGHFRKDKKNWQRLVWLSPNGRTVTGR